MSTDDAVDRRALDDPLDDPLDDDLDDPGDPGDAPHDLASTEWVALLSAWVSRLAVDAGIRAFIIKGPVVAIQGLRPERESADVDLWVDPRRITDYLALLHTHGWAELVNDRPSILPSHARTMRNPRWGCELDVHDRFPGFFAERDEVFERLWALRTTETLATVGVETLDRVGNATVLALHLLRDLRHGRPELELAFLSDVVGEFTPAERTALAELVASCGANQTAAPFLESAGIDPVPGPVASQQDLEDWRLLTRTHGAPTVYWLHRLTRTPWWRWPGLLWRAFWMSDEQIRLSEPGTGTSTWAMLGARIRRLRRGVAVLPRAVRLLGASRRDRRPRE